MGRKPKCTVEEKISAVEDYLNGIRSVSEIMVDLSIKSTRTIRDWILAYQNGGIKALCPVTANHSYSSEFKIEMVRKYINGEGSVTDLCARYGIPTHTKQLCQFFHRFLGVMQQGVTHFWRTAGIKHFHLIDTFILQRNIWIYKRI